jgi:hypothetical protein
VAYRIGTCAPRDVEREVASLYEGMFPRGDPTFVGRAFEWLIQCFDGSQPGYQAIDLRYHDLEHTMQGTLCLMRLLQGYRAAKALPEVSQDWFELALLAILFHDTGYLKRRDDTEGTGAKYTAIHVGRSAAFAREFVIPRGYSEADADAIENMIRCTGVATDLGDIPFRGDTDRVLGFALATADLLGQMAAPDYVEKLPALFEEFAEAARAGGETAARFAVYTSAEELRRRTPGFWEYYVWPRINLEFLGLHRFLNHPYPEGPNPYVQQIERNIARVRGQLVS